MEKSFRTHACIAAVVLLAAPVAAQDPVVYRVLGEKKADQFGISLAALDDVNGDGVNDFVAGGVPPFTVTDPRSWGYVRLHSGKNGEVLRIWRGTRDVSNFGYEVAAIGDLDGDGIREFAAAAVSNQIVILSPSSEEWIKVVQVPSLSSSKSLFAVLDCTDLDGDGMEDMVVGNPSETIGMTPPWILAAGRVMAFSSRSWEMIWDLRGTTERGFLGNSLTAIGDLDGDGISEVAVGEPRGKFSNEDDGPGRVQILKGRTGEVLRIIDQDPGTSLGSTLANLGDLDGDGFVELAISSPGYRTTRGRAQGWVGVYSTKTFEVVRTYLGLEGELTDVFQGDALGYRLAAVGDVDVDGIPDFAIAAYRRGDGIGPDYGRIDLRSGLTGKLLAAYQERQPNAVWLGEISSLGDVDGDARPEFLVSAPSLPDVFADLSRGEVVALRFEPRLPQFLRGDANGDGRVTISDAITILRKLFLGVDLGDCLVAYDADADERISILDYVRVVGWIFLRGFSPSPPFPECGRFGGLRQTPFDCRSSPCMH